MNERSRTITLEVPFYSQYAKDNGLKEAWKDRSCGILSLKMIFKYYRDAEIQTQPLLNRALELGGSDKNGDWYHSTLVKTAIDYGYTSWRRSWIPSSRDVEHFKKEGVNTESLTAWKAQLKAESIPVITAEIASGHPLIVSAPPNFEEDDKAHLLVLNGVSYDERGNVSSFHYLDPYNSKDDQVQDKVSLEAFKKQWTYRAIFIHTQR